MDQGDIYLINLDPTLQQRLEREAWVNHLINAMNHNSPRLIIAPLHPVLGDIPFEVFVPAGVGGLGKDLKSCSIS